MTVGEDDTLCSEKELHFFECNHLKNDEKIMVNKNEIENIFYNFLKIIDY